MLLGSNPVSSRRSRHDMLGGRCKVYWIYMCDCVDIVESVAAWWWWWILKLNVTGPFGVAFESNPRSPVDWSKMLETAVLLEIGNVPAVAGAASTCFGLEAGDLAVVAVATALECGALPMAPKLPDELGKWFVFGRRILQDVIHFVLFFRARHGIRSQIFGTFVPRQLSDHKIGDPLLAQLCTHCTMHTMIAEFPISQPSTFHCTGHNLPQSVHAHGHVDKPGTAVMWTIVIDAEKKCIALRVRWAFGFIKFIQANGTPTGALNILEDFGCKLALVRGVSSTRFRQPLIPFKVGLATIFFWGVMSPHFSCLASLHPRKPKPFVVQYHTAWTNASGLPSPRAPVSHKQVSWFSDKQEARLGVFPCPRDFSSVRLALTTLAVISSRFVSCPSSAI